MPSVGKCPDTPHSDDICLETWSPEDTRCVQNANALTLLVWKADAVSCVVRKIFALTFCVWRHALYPEGKCTETPRPEYI